MRTKSKSTQWHLIVILTRGIAMSRDTNNATCHTQDLETWHFYFLFFKKLKKKLKKIKKTTDWHVARWLTALVNSVWKGPDWSTFSKVEMQLTIFLNRVPIWHTSPKLDTIRVIIPKFFYKHWSKLLLISFSYKQLPIR